MSRALDHLYVFRELGEAEYKIILQIHDAVILEVPIKYIEKVYDEILPMCMSDLVDIWPCTLDGKRKPGVTKPHHLGIGRDVYLHWGDHIPMLASEKLGIPARFCSPKGDDQEVLDLLKNPGWAKYANSR